MSRIIEHLTSLTINCKNGDVAEISVTEGGRLVGTISHQSVNLRDPDGSVTQFRWLPDGTLLANVHSKGPGHDLDPKAITSARKLVRDFLNVLTATPAL